MYFKWIYSEMLSIFDCRSSAVEAEHRGCNQICKEESSVHPCRWG